MLKSILLSASLLCQTLAAPTISISIDLDTYDDHLPAHHQLKDVRIPLETEQFTLKPPVPPADRIEKELNAYNKQANASSVLIGEVKKGDADGIKKVIASIQKQNVMFKYGARKIFGPITEGEIENLPAAYWALTGALFHEVRAVVKHDSSLCHQDVLSDLTSALSLLSSEYTGYSERVEWLMPPCRTTTTKSAACEIREDIATGTGLVPMDISDAIEYLEGTAPDAEGCPYSSSKDL